MAASNIKTRILVISDTHGKKPLETGSDETTNPPTQAYRYPLPKADIAIHCGDLTLGSNVEEFEATFSMIRALDAPLKLVIAGNHDLALDRAFWEDHALHGFQAKYLTGKKRELYMKRPDQVAAIIEAARQDGVRYLEEGTHEVELQNGARLRVYASPMTPEFGGWAFQYPYGQHDYDIPVGGIDIAITHGPPKKVMDECRSGDNAGCPQLFSAVAKARPKIHCFGHIHEAWGAELVTWRRPLDMPMNIHFNNAVDWRQSRVLHNLNRLVPGERDSKEEAEKKMERRRKMYEEKCAPLDISSSGPSPLRFGEQTLFLNAAIMDIHYHPTNVPWLVDVDLPVSGASK
ncbi:rhamnogalacturonate lyase C like protein [Verticillium longisporum]|uniref:Rhamnogalacturonate lyase C like protein n=2 Tax=Verticillium longisporum TaxID=100787 RepID=A0A8I3ANZ7_VERLO|nr:rhamnogalacturonate lyase C like protein [Verticillium longisporum]